MTSKSLTNPIWLSISSCGLLGTNQLTNTNINLGKHASTHGGRVADLDLRGNVILAIGLEGVLEVASRVLTISILFLPQTDFIDQG